MKERDGSGAGAALSPFFREEGLDAWPGDDDPPELSCELSRDSLLQEAAARSRRARGGGAMDFFWATLAPMSVVGSLGAASVVLVAAFWVLSLPAAEALRAAGLAGAAAALIFLPINYYLVRTRLERPLTRLQSELQGYLPWQPQGDVLLGSLRRAIETVRNAAYEAREELEEEGIRLEETHARLRELQEADRFVNQVAEELRSAEPLPEVAARMSSLVHSVWPADHILLFRVTDSELQAVYREEGGRVLEPQSDPDKGRYRKTSLPAPLREGLRRGFFVETGLPFSRDAGFPDARSYVVMTLDHRGPAAGLLFLASSELSPPPAEPLKRARPLFSSAYSRSAYFHEMEEAAIRDSLTGTYTQDHFLSLLRHEIARTNRYSRPCTCLVLDIDGLRRVNDVHGARFGDQIINEVAQLAKGLLRSTDSLARLGGGTFAALLPETTGESARIVAERLRERMGEYPFILQRGTVERITVSAGLASHPPHGVTAFSLLDAARAAMDESKDAGGNAVLLSRVTSPVSAGGVAAPTPGPPAPAAGAPQPRA